MMSMKKGRGSVNFFSARGIVCGTVKLCDHVILPRIGSGGSVLGVAQGCHSRCFIVPLPSMDKKAMKATLEKVPKVKNDKVGVKAMGLRILKTGSIEEAANRAIATKLGHETKSHLISSLLTACLLQVPRSCHSQVLAP